MLKKMFFIFLVIGCLTMVFGADERPVAVSPGNASVVSMVDVNCPTFSWTAVSWARAYKIAIFDSLGVEGILTYRDLKFMTEPVIEQEIRGSALSWTPSAELGLKDGSGYVWFVQAIDAAGSGVWSMGKQFKVNTAVKFDRMFERIKVALKEAGVEEDGLRELFGNLKTRDQQETPVQAGQGTGAVLNQNMPLVSGSEGDANGNCYYGLNSGNGLGGGTNWNAFFGYNSGYSTNSGDGNTFIGYQAGYYNNAGSNNTFLGDNTGAQNTSGNYNTFLGYWTGYSNQTGSSNTCLGYYAGYNNISGNNNVFLGHYAGYNETGSNKLYIENSNLSSPLIYGEFDNNIVSINGKLGVASSGNYIPAYELDVDGYVKTKYFMQASIAPQMRWYETDAADASDFFKMNYHASALEFIWYDASATTTYMPIKMEGDGYVGINNTNPSHMLDVGTSGAYCNGGSWVDGSSIEYKENVQGVELDEAIETLTNLKPVKFNYKDDKEEQHLGFIAEEVPELVSMKDRKGLSAMDVVSVLTRVVQDLRSTINAQNKVISEQEQADNKRDELINNQNKVINDLLKRIEKLENRK